MPIWFITLENNWDLARCHTLIYKMRASLPPRMLFEGKDGCGLSVLDRVLHICNQTEISRQCHEFFIKLICAVSKLFKLCLFQFSATRVLFLLQNDNEGKWYSCFIRWYPYMTKLRLNKIITQIFYVRLVPPPSSFFLFSLLPFSPSYSSVSESPGVSQGRRASCDIVLSKGAMGAGRSGLEATV